MVADNYEDLVKCGYLEMKLPRKHRKFGTQRQLEQEDIVYLKAKFLLLVLSDVNDSSKEQDAWKRKWFILRRKSSQGTPRLEYHKNTFISMATENENNMKEWIRLIKKLVLPEPKRTISLPRPEGSFPVTVIYTEDSERLSLAGDYLLVVTPEQLLLYRADDRQRRSSVVAQWDLDDIPRFRLQKLNQLNDTEKIFIVNLARTGQTLEGEFQFLTQNGREILETVKSHTKQRSRNNDESPRSSPVGVDESPRSSPVGVAASNSSLGLDGGRSRSCSGHSQLSRQSNSDSSTPSAKDLSSSSTKDNSSTNSNTVREEEDTLLNK